MDPLLGFNPMLRSLKSASSDAENRVHFSARCASDVLALQAHGDAHAAADAQGSEALLGIAPAHLMQQGHEHAGARGADRVADGDGAAVLLRSNLCKFSVRKRRSLFPASFLPSIRCELNHSEEDHRRCGCNERASSRITLGCVANLEKRQGKDRHSIVRSGSKQIELLGK